MLKSLHSVLLHELKIVSRQAYSWLTPLLFFLIVVSLFPLALDNNPELLTHIAPGIIWVAALLALLLSIGNLFRSDTQDGYLEQLLLSPQPLTLLVVCRILSHWLTHGLPLVLLSPLLGCLLNLSAHTTVVLMLTLLLGTPILSLLGGIGAALTVGLRNPGLLLPVLIMPLYIPVLIFGTGILLAVEAHYPVSGYFAIMGALLLLSLAFAPLLTAIALRIGVSH